MRASGIVLVVLLAARAQAQPAPLAILDVPYVSQSESLCGGAAAAMVLRFWGERGVSAETFAPLVDRSAAGIATTTLVDALTARGWNARGLDGSDRLVEDELASGRPVIALIEDRARIYHYIVVVGVTERAVIFHDPARAPLRVMSREEFERRWRGARHWMAIVLPPPARPTSGPPASPAAAAAAGSACDERVELGISQAQANQLEDAARTLTTALSCPGSAAVRELAGVRFLERRWDDAAQLATQAVSIDSGDRYAWELLGTSRFLLDAPLDALDAWNHVSEPRLDLVRVAGLERTRQRPVEQMLGLDTGQTITSAAFTRAERALRDLPSARSTRLELVPRGEGLAEVHATLVERDVLPDDRLSWVVIGGRAAVMRTASVTLGSLTGAGESLSLEWRFWSGRPRLAASLRAPAPWPGTWGADLFGESQAFDLSQPSSERRGGRFTASRWVTPALRVDVRAGADRWNTVGTVAAFGTTGGFLSGAERLSVRVAADAWAGTSRFSSLSANLMAASAARTVVSGAVPLGPAVVVSGGLSAVTGAAPLDLWPAGDTGLARSILARAHPVLEDGRMRVSRLGRLVAYGSMEGQYWWKAPALSRFGAAAFLDLVRTADRIGGTAALNDADVGLGIGVASLLVPGRFRLDVAHGLRDGANAVTVRYVVTPW